MIRPELLTELKRLNRKDKLEIIRHLNEELSLDGGDYFDLAEEKSLTGTSRSTTLRRPTLSVQEAILNQQKGFDLLAKTQSLVEKALYLLDDGRQNLRDKKTERQTQHLRFVHADLSSQQANLVERIEDGRLTETQLADVKRFVSLLKVILERHVSLTKICLDLHGERSESTRKYIDVERETLTTIAQDLVERRLSDELHEDHIEHTESFLANISKRFDFGVQPAPMDVASVVREATKSSDGGQRVTDAPSVIELDTDSIVAEARNVVALVSAEVNRAQEIRHKHSEAQLSVNERAILKRSKVMQAILVEAQKLAQQIETLDPKDVDRLDALGHRLTSLKRQHVVKLVDP